MQPTLHGLEQIQKNNVVIEKIPTDKVNVTALIDTFETNMDKAKNHDFMTRYATIAAIYHELFTTGDVSDATTEELSFELIEITSEHIDGEIEEYMKKPAVSSGDNYYYEYARSFGVEQQASQLKEHLDSECDFI